MSTRINARWYPPTARGTLTQLDGVLAPTWHVGGLLSPVDGVGGFNTQVDVDRPTRFRVSAQGHRPMEFTIDPSMTGVSISSDSRMDRGHAQTFAIAYSYPRNDAEREQLSAMQTPYIPPRYAASGATANFVDKGGSYSFATDAFGRPLQTEAPTNFNVQGGAITIVGMPHGGATFIDGQRTNDGRSQWEDASLTRWRVPIATNGRHEIVVVAPNGERRVGYTVTGWLSGPWYDMPWASMKIMPSIDPALSGGYGASSGLYRASGYPLGATVATIPMNEHTPPSEAVKFYQRLLLGIGFSTGAQGADGILGENTANSLAAFARWYNQLPEGAPPSAADMMNGVRLTRGPRVAEDRLLTPEKQTALQRFNARSSEQLTSLQVQRFESPLIRDTAFPWGSFIAAITAGTALIVVVAYADSHQRSKAQRPAHA